MSQGVPARIDRAALERIIQRAAELQTSERDIGDNLTSDEVMALGREVGIPGRYLQQALLEEQTRLVAAGTSGLLQRLAGPEQVAAQRVVRGERDALELSLIRWLEQQELFCVQRHQPGRVAWEPIGGIQAAIRRATAAAGATKRPMMLARADSLAATFVELEPGYCHVSLTASARKSRNESLTGSAAIVSAGAVGSGLMIALGALLPVALIPAPLALGVGYLVLRRHGPVLSRLHLGLERALDSLEQTPIKAHYQPDRPIGVLGLLADEVRKALKS